MTAWGAWRGTELAMGTGKDLGGERLKRAGHTSGVVVDDCVHESWHDDSKGGHSGEAEGWCHRVGAQRWVVAKLCDTGTGTGEEEEKCGRKTKES